MSDNEFISIPEAARMLKVSIVTIYCYINEGRLTKYKKINRPLLLRKEVEELLIPKPAN